MKKSMRKRPKVVAVDFDGTICQMYATGGEYVPKRSIGEKPNAKVVAECRALRRRGVRVVIYSSRWWGDYHWIKEWLDKHRVPYDDIVLGKFKADAFMDDTTVNPSVDPGWRKRLARILRPA